MFTGARAFIRRIVLVAAAATALFGGEAAAHPRHARRGARAAHHSHHARHRAHHRHHRAHHRSHHDRHGHAQPAERAVDTVIVAPAVDASSSSRREEALRSLERSGLVRRCWTQHLMRFPTTPARTLALAVHVDPAGAITLAVPGERSSLAGCVEIGAHRLPHVAAGSALDANTTVALELGAP